MTKSQCSSAALEVSNYHEQPYQEEFCEQHTRNSTTNMGSMALPEDADLPGLGDAFADPP